MPVLTIRRWNELDEPERERILARSTAAIFEPDLMSSIETIFGDVRRRGDQAVLEATGRFDRVHLTAERLAVSEAEIEAAHAALDPDLLGGIREAIANSRRFNEAQLEATAADWQREIRPGFLVGERFARSRASACSSRPARRVTRRSSARSAPRRSSRVSPISS